jgi:hypothetical protein
MVAGTRVRLFGCGLLLVLATLLFFAPVIFSDKIFISRDHYLFYNPRSFFAAESMRQGVLPLWNPYVGCGVPFQANLQSAIFYPLSALYYLLPFQSGYKYFIIVHYLLGALGMFHLMRRWGSSQTASLYAGLVFAFGGYLASINDNVAFVTAGIWLPLVLACYHQALRTGSYPYAALTGLVIAVQIYAGDASFCVLASLMCMVIYTFFWPVINREPQSCSRLQQWKLLGLGWVAGVGLAAIQLLPFSEFVSYSHRLGGLGFEQRTRHSLHPLELLQLLIPYAFGSTVPQTRWFGQMWLDTAYLGVFPGIFAAVFIACTRDRLKYFLLSLAGLGLFLALGKYNPLFRFAHWIIPGVNMIQFPVKFLCITSFALAVMAGKGLECCSMAAHHQGRTRAIARAVFCVLLCLAGLLTAGSFYKQQAYAFLGRLYPGGDYFTPLAEQSLVDLFNGVSILAALLAAFLCLAVLVWKKPRLTGGALVIALLLTFADLALVGKPRDEYLTASLINEKNDTVRFLEQDASLYRIYTIVRGDAERSFLHLYNRPFEPIYRMLQRTLRPNMNMYHHISAAGEYAELLNRAFYDVFLRAENALKEENPAPAELAYSRPTLDLFNVKYLLSPYALNDPHLKLVKDGPIRIYENPDALPRVFFVHRVAVAASEQAVLDMMQAPSFDPRQVACISPSEAQKLPAGTAPEGGAAENNHSPRSIEVMTYGLNRIFLRVGDGRPGLMILADNYYPGWKALIDHRPAPVLRVDHTLRGVWVEAGVHDVQFEFKPIALTLGAFISLLTGAAVLVSLTVFKMRARSCAGQTTITNNTGHICQQGD